MAWLWTWRVSPDQLRAFISRGTYSHAEHGLELTARIDEAGGVEVEVRVTPEPLGDEGPGSR